MPASIRAWALAKAEAFMASRPPDFEIGPAEDRYLRRWIVGPWGRGDPKNLTRFQRIGRKFPNLYLHQIRHDDEDRALHDHPFASISWLLKNSYAEVIFYPLLPETIAALAIRGEPRPTVKIFRPEGKLVFRRADVAHRLVLDKVPGRLGRLDDVEVISAFFVGFRTREWGFYCPKRWVPWLEFVDARDRGSVGAGCGD